MKRFLLLSTSIIIVLASCRNRNDFLQKSLDLANENREELEKVLNHYAVNEADSLKYQASTFLICNMAGKNSLDTSSVAANQLFYWDGGWQSLGKQRGRKDYRLVYDNVPENALLRIHNHSRGKENRPFLYKNGKQEFW